MFGLPLTRPVHADTCPMRAEYKEDTAIVTKNACVVVKRVPAPKTGGLLAKIKALDAAAALQSTATYE